MPWPPICIADLHRTHSQSPQQALCSDFWVEVAALCEFLRRWAEDMSNQAVLDQELGLVASGLKNSKDSARILAGCMQYPERL